MFFSSKYYSTIQSALNPQMWNCRYGGPTISYMWIFNCAVSAPLMPTLLKGQVYSG